jgi:hypothetical protein
MEEKIISFYKHRGAIVSSEGIYFLFLKKNYGKHQL